jgi:predicted acetyltransferase
VELRDPDPALRVEFQRMAEEFRAAGEGRYGDLASLDAPAFADYVTRLDRRARGEALERGTVAERTFWLLTGGTVAGVSRLRPRLDPLHERLAGHIGFDIAPSFRTGDTGARLFALTLTKARELGLTQVLLCCDPEKTDRRRIVAAAGGTLLDEVSGVLPEGDAYRKVRYVVPV